MEKSGTDEIESKIFSFLFDADGDGKISFEEVLQSTGFMETDGKYAVTYHSTFSRHDLDMDVQAKLFFELVDKDGNGHISKVKITDCVVNILRNIIKYKRAISD